MSKRGGGGDKKEQFWDALVSQKLQQVRWGVANAGVAPATRNNDGQTSFMVAASRGCDRSLGELVRWYERRLNQLRECLQQVDDDGRTPMHLACAAPNLGGAKCVAELLDAWLAVSKDDRMAGLKQKDSKGKTPVQVAQAEKNKKAVDVIAEWLTEPETDSEDEAIAEDGLTSTQRSKLKKKTLASAERRGNAAAAPEVEEQAQAPASSAQPKPSWPEVVAWVESVEVKLTPIYELSVDRRQEEAGLPTFPAVGDISASSVDPALWWCASLNRLHLKLPGPSLRSLPSAGLARLANLTILMVAGHELTELPAAICSLPLKSLDAARNLLTTLPEPMPASLESIDVSNNSLTTVGALRTSLQLVSVLVDLNVKLTKLELPFPEFKRLVTLSACGCSLTEIDGSVGQLSKMETLKLNDCPITELPDTLRECKKLKEIQVDRTKIKDNKVLGYIQKGEMKQLQKYWEKNAKGGGSSKGGKKKK